MDTDQRSDENQAAATDGDPPVDQTSETSGVAGGSVARKAERRGGSVPAEIEAALKALVATLPAAEAAQVLAATGNRAVALLHKVARDAAEGKRGTTEWGRWARLQNSARDAVLRTAAAREVANEIAGNDVR